MTIGEASLSTASSPTFLVIQSPVFDSAFDFSVSRDPDLSSRSSWTSSLKSVSAGDNTSSHHLLSIQPVESLVHGLGTPSLTKT